MSNDLEALAGRSHIVCKGHHEKPVCAEPMRSDRKCGEPGEGTFLRGQLCCFLELRWQGVLQGYGFLALSFKVMLLGLLPQKPVHGLS